MIAALILIPGALVLLAYAFIRGATQKETPPVVQRFREHEGDDTAP